MFYVLSDECDMNFSKMKTSLIYIMTMRFSGTSIRTI